MSFKVFCAAKESDKGGKMYFQGWTRQFGMITVFTGERKSDGKDLLIVNIARPFRKRSFKVTQRASRYSTRRSYASKRSRSNYSRRNS